MKVKLGEHLDFRNGSASPARASDGDIAVYGANGPIGFAARAKPGFHSFRIVHSALGSKVLPHTLGRLSAEHYSPAELEWVDSLARSLSD